MMTNIELRRKILKMVYERYTEHPYYRITPNEFRKELGVDLRTLNFNIIYLEEKGFLELQKPLEGNIFVGARITPKGIDLVEDEFQFDTMFPLIKEQKEDSIDIEKELEEVIKRIKLSDLSEEKKELLIEEFTNIKDEFKTPMPSYIVIKRNLEKIKERDDDLGTELADILKNPSIMNILQMAAKREDKSG